MSCYTSQYGEPQPTVKQMAPIQEVNPRLLEAALHQLQMSQAAPMSSTDSVRIVNTPSEAPIHMAAIPQDMINSRAFNDSLNQQDLIAQRAADVLRAELGYDPYHYDIGQYYRPQ